MDDIDRKRILAGVLKKATGYESVETQEEYALNDGDMVLVKRKITKKDVPPDLGAVKLLLEDMKPESVGMEELEEERKALREEYFALLRADSNFS